jgi:hypothetical protein
MRRALCRSPDCCGSPCSLAVGACWSRPAPPSCRAAPRRSPSHPTGARLFLDGAESGKTPFVASIKRKDKHVIQDRAGGYRPPVRPPRPCRRTPTRHSVLGTIAPAPSRPEAHWRVPATAGAVVLRLATAPAPTETSHPPCRISARAEAGGGEGVPAGGDAIGSVLRGTTAHASRFFGMPRIGGVAVQVTEMTSSPSRRCQIRNPGGKRVRSAQVAASAL